MKTQLPKPYLSPSQIELAMTNPEGYVRKYIYGEESAASIQQEFGKTITDILEGRTKVPRALKKQLASVPKYRANDVEISCQLKQGKETVRLMGFLDGENPEIQGEYKTGMVPWTQKRVSDSLQLRLYALIKYKNTGSIPFQELTWLETKWEGAEIELTGKAQTFKVLHTVQTMLETEALVWKAYKKILALVEQELNNL